MSEARGQYTDTSAIKLSLCGVDVGAKPRTLGFEAGGGGATGWYVRTDVMFVMGTSEVVVVFQCVWICFSIVGEIVRVVVE